MQYRTPRAVALSAFTVPGRLSVRRVLQWVYLTRLLGAAAVFAAAVLSWDYASRSDTLVASLLFATAMVVTAASALYTHVYRRAIAPVVLYLQAVFDVFLVTATVHLTWETSYSQLAPLYILVIATAAILLPTRGIPLVAALAILLYAAEAMLVRGIGLSLSVFVQLAVFATVAFGSAFIATRLRSDGATREALAEELARFRLHQHEVERLLLRAERLEAVAELGASMAHELKNPLASIRSAVEQLSQSPRSPEDERVLTTLVMRESDRLARLLTTFLDFARADAPVLQRLDILSVVRNAADLAAAHPGRAEGVRVEYDFAHGYLELDGDEDMLHRAFFNLVLNALQVAPAGSVVRIEAATLLPQQLDWRAASLESGAIAVRVIDGGPGVPDHVRARIFDPFFTTRDGGSGLGLAIVHRAVEAHRGVVVVENGTPGARFTVLLPRA